MVIKFILPLKKRLKNSAWGFSGGAVVKNPPANAGDTCRGATKPVRHNY